MSHVSRGKTDVAFMRFKAYVTRVSHVFQHHVFFLGDGRLPDRPARGCTLRPRARGKAAARPQGRPQQPRPQRLHAPAHRLQEE